MNIYIAWTIDKPRGYSHVKTYGDVPQFWVFLQEINNNGSHFHEKIPNYGSDFQKFSGICIANPEKFWEFGVFLWQNRTKWVLFSEKSLNMGTFFGENYPWTWVWVLSCTSPTNPNLITPSPKQTKNYITTGPISYSSSCWGSFLSTFMRTFIGFISAKLTSTSKNMTWYTMSFGYALATHMQEFWIRTSNIFYEKLRRAHILFECLSHTSSDILVTRYSRMLEQT